VQLPDLDQFTRLPLDQSTEFLLNMGLAVLAALVGGVIAQRAGLPTIVGYVLAGVALGPLATGLVGRPDTISALAEIGVVLLLFAIGVEFSLHELRRVGRLAVGGATAQVAITLAIGAALMVGLGFSLRPALVLGATAAISSTVVLVKLLAERGEETSLHGRIGIGWMIVQDVLTIVFIVTLPAFTGDDLVVPLALAAGKAALFLALAYGAGRILLPPVYRAIAGSGSRELFLLTVVATALLTAFVSSVVFGLSLALGAFVAGVVVSESELSHQAVAEILPFRDLFAVLLFVSVGMLVDPAALLASAPLVVALLLVAVPFKGALAALLSWRSGLPARVAILTGAAVAHVGEFSFIIGQNALDLGIIDRAAYNLVLGTTVGSIVIAPFGYLLARRAALGIDRGIAERRQRRPADDHQPGAAGDVVILGGGRVGRTIAEAVVPHVARTIVVDHDARLLADVRRVGAIAVYGDAANPHILRRVIAPETLLVVIAVPDHLTAYLAAERVHAIEPNVEMLARVNGEEELRDLAALKVRHFADSRIEVAIELAHTVLGHVGVEGDRVVTEVERMHRDAYGGPGGIHPG
jgi:CPA2 family monovalent cation:H+ antiporter-2